jgi:hypothetical protein
MGQALTLLPSSQRTSQGSSRSSSPPLACAPPTTVYGGGCGDDDSVFRAEFGLLTHRFQYPPDELVCEIQA